MRILTSIIVLSFFSCNIGNVPYWEKQKGNFKYHNKSEFVSDSMLRADYKTYKKSRHSLFDDFVSNEPVYLYSWQDRDNTKNEFTVIKDNGERGLTILYFILDKKDSLLSWTQIAGMGNEGGNWFETRSKFIHKDTILQISAITQWLDFDKKQEMTKTKGDSTFSHLCIDSIGKVIEREIRKVIEIDFKNGDEK